MLGGFSLADATLPKLTDRERRFVEFYTGEAAGNASKAARLAGYAEKKGQLGWELKQKPEIRAHIDAILDAESMTQSEIRHELTAVARRPLESCVEVHEYGQTVSARMDASAKMKALELLGKAHQMFTDKQSIDFDGGLKIEIAGMADDELP